MTLAFTIALLMLAVGLYRMIAADRIAARNRDRVESGRERFFEERRAWIAYGTRPLTESRAIRRDGRRTALVGVAIGAAATYLHFFPRT